MSEAVRRGCSLLFVFLMLVPLSARGEGARLTLWPEDPAVGDQIIASVFFPGVCQLSFTTHPSGSITQVDNVIRARFLREFPGAGCGALGARFEFMVGKLPGGAYRLEVELEGLESTREALDFVVSQRESDSELGPSVDFSGLWWDPEESGWALTLHQYQQGTLWASFLTFDASGGSRWVMTLPGRWENGVYIASMVEVFDGPDVLTDLSGEVLPHETETEIEIVGEMRIFLGGDPENPTATPILGRMPLEAVVRYSYRGTSQLRYLRRFEMP